MGEINNPILPVNVSEMTEYEIEDFHRSVAYRQAELASDRLHPSSMQAREMSKRDELELMILAIDNIAEGIRWLTHDHRKRHMAKMGDSQYEYSKFLCNDST